MDKTTGNTSSESSNPHSTSGRVLSHERRDLFRRQDGAAKSRRRHRSRHSPDDTGVLVLGDDGAASLDNGLAALQPVLAHAGQNHGRRMAAVNLGDAGKQGIDGWPAKVNRRIVAGKRPSSCDKTFGPPVEPPMARTFGRTALALLRTYDFLVTAAAGRPRRNRRWASPKASTFTTSSSRKA